MTIVNLLNCDPKLSVQGIDFSGDYNGAMAKLDVDLRSLLGDIQWSYFSDSEGSIQIMSDGSIAITDSLSMYGDVQDVIYV